MWVVKDHDVAFSRESVHKEFPARRWGQCHVLAGMLESIKLNACFIYCKHI